LIYHLKRNATVVLRHAAGMALATVLARPLLDVMAGYLAWEERVGRRQRQVATWNRAARANGATMSPLRILYLRSQFWFGLSGGGSVAHAAGVVGGLQQSRATVHLVSSDHLKGIETPTTLVPPECWFDGRLKESEEVVYNGPFLRAALAQARRWRPHALYQRYTALNVSGAILSRLLGIPFVLEFNSSDVWKGRHWGEFAALSLAERGERVNLRAADVVVVVSQVLRDGLAASGTPARKILVNPNAVDPERFSPDVPTAEVRARYNLGSRVVLGFSGTFGVWHGIPTLAATLPLVLRRRPDVRFLLVGDGALRYLVDEAVHQHHLQDLVVCTGLVPHDQMPAYLAACDVLLSPHGRQADGGEFFGSPTKLYEYMAAGQAIVASAVGQIGEVLEDEATALLVPPDDPEALCGAILRLVDDPALRRRLGVAARARAEREHTWRRNAERVLDAVRSL
jgi:glycosyltransferase involved in cell wall biosynthesis